jgi:hypothetical protein
MVLHTHKNDIGYLIPFGQGGHLIKDLRNGKIALETLFTCHTKQTIHFAAHLCGNT